MSAKSATRATVRATGNWRWKQSNARPGVQRMLALVGSESSFEQGREQAALLAGLEVTSKAVERQAEAIGADVEAQQQEHNRRAKQLELPAVYAPTVPLLYIEMDGTGVPIVQAETEGRMGKIEANRRTPAKSNWAVCSRKPQRTKKAVPCATRTPPPMPPPSRVPRSSDSGSIPKLGAAVGAGRKEGRDRRRRGMDLESRPSTFSRID